MAVKTVTEEEKQRRLALVRTGLAFGGQVLSPSAEANLIDIMDGKQSHDEAVAKLLSKYTRKKT